MRIARYHPIAAISAAALLALATVACTPQRDYPIPPQRVMPAGLDPALATRVLRISDSLYRHRIVQDVLIVDPGSQWTWTNQSPRFKLGIDDAQGWAYHVEFTVPGVVIQRLRRISVAFVVNDRVLATRSYTKDTHDEFDQLVPDEILRLADPVVFGLNVDPVYIAEGDGMKLGVLLEAIGFRKVPAP